MYGILGVNFKIENISPWINDFSNFAWKNWYYTIYVFTFLKKQVRSKYDRSFSFLVVNVTSNIYNTLV